MRGLTKKEKILIQYGFLLILISLTTYLVSTTLDVNVIPKIIKMVDIKFIILGIVLVAFYIWIESVILKLIINSIQKTPVRFIGAKLATMGMYYNLVTPFASGSQPMQVYTLMKYDINFSKSMAIVTNKTVLYQSIVTMYSAILVFSNMKLLSREMPSIMLLVTVGIIMNITLLLGGLFIIISPNNVKSILGYFVNFLVKFKIFKFLEIKRDNINNYVDEFNFSIRVFIKDKKALFISIIMTIVQLTVFFSLVYCVYKAFGLSGTPYSKLITLQVFLYMSISPIPTPGNVGANELVFLTIFKDIFPKYLIGYSVFLYSGFVYYFIIIICGILTIRTHYQISKKDKNMIKASKEDVNI